MSAGIGLFSLFYVGFLRTLSLFCRKPLFAGMKSYIFVVAQILK